MLISALNATMKHVPTQDMNLPRFQVAMEKSQVGRKILQFSKRSKRNRGFYRVFPLSRGNGGSHGTELNQAGRYGSQGSSHSKATPESPTFLGGRTYTHCLDMAAAKLLPSNASNARRITMDPWTTCCSTCLPCQTSRRSLQCPCSPSQVDSKSLRPQLKHAETKCSRSSLLKPSLEQEDNQNIKLKLHRNLGSTLQFQDSVE